MAQRRWERNTWPVDIYHSFKRFSVHYSISWKCFGPSRSAQRVFTASAIQTLVSQSCSNWSLCWYYFRPSLCYFFGDSSESKSKCRYVAVARYVTGRIFGSSIFVDTDCNKRGQTSCPVVGVEVQTGDYFEASQCNRYHFLGAAYCLCSNEPLLEFPYSLKVQIYSCITLSRNFDLLLYKDFPHPPSSSKSTSRPCSTAQPNKSTEHSAIQKGSINGTVFAVCVSHLLYTTRNIETQVH